MSTKARFLPPHAFYALGLLALLAAYGLVETGRALAATALLVPALPLLCYTTIRRANILSPTPKRSSLPRPATDAAHIATGASRSRWAILCILLSVPLLLGGLLFHVVGDSGGQAGDPLVGLGAAVEYVGTLAMFAGAALLLLGLALPKR